MAYGLEDPMPPSTELDKLQAEAEYLTKTLDRLNTRIEELRSKKPDRR